VNGAGGIPARAKKEATLIKDAKIGRNEVGWVGFIPLHAMSVLDLIPKKKKKKAPKGVSTPAIKVPHYQPPLVPSQNPVPARLARKLRNLGGKFRFVKTTERIAQYVSTAVMLLTLQMFLDWLVDLSLLVRALILAADIALLVYFVRKQVLLLILRPPNLEACALMVEKHWPRFHGRMIASVQLGGPRFTADSPELVQAVQHDTDARTATLDFGQIVPTRMLARRIWIALAVTVVWAGLMVMIAPGSIALLKRVFLLPAKVPRKTEIICLSGNKIIPAGDSVLIEALARGIVPSHGRVTLVDDSGRIQEITLDPERDQTDHFSLKIDKVEQSLTYTIRLNDATSDTYEVKTVPRPNVTSIDCEQVYPAYTGLPPVKRTVGNLALLAGSQLKIHAVTNSKIVRASLKLVGGDKVLPLTVGGADGNDLKGQIDIPAEGLTGFSIQITNEAGITSGDETQYRIDLIPDHPPAIQLTYPERLQELYTLKAKPTIAFVASDDYGLAKIALCYRIVEDQDSISADTSAAPPPPPPAKRIEMELGQGQPQNMKNRYEWDLAAIQPALTEGTTLEYWMEAEDANNVTGPGVSDSEHHTIKIVSDIEKKAEVMNRLMDSLSTITDISQNQEKINKDLGEAIQGKQDKK
jgi:hypothetical protein